MKTKWLICICLIFLVPIVHGMANYGDLNYGNCNYGKNSPPTIQAFQPSDTTPDFTSPINVTFNITGDDCEDDAILEWFVDGKTNTTNENLSILFTESETTFNVTGNLSDSFDFVIQSWIVSINISISGNISDVLIVPTITADGNLMVVTVNITALNKNLTGMFAYLNINANFLFLSDTPQNKSVGNVYTNNVTQVNWFLATPLVKNKESLNVTYVDDTSASFQGVKKDLIIKGDQEMPIAVILTVLFVIVIYFFILSKLFTERQFTESGMIKLLFYLTAFWVILLPLDMAVQFNIFNGVPVVVTSHLNLLFQIIIWINSFITFYFILWFLIELLKKVGNTKNKLRFDKQPDG